MTTGVIPTENTTNTPNDLFFYQFTCSVPCNDKLLKLPCFSAILLYTHFRSVLQPNNSNMNFILITIPFPTHISFIRVSFSPGQMDGMLDRSWFKLTPNWTTVGCMLVNYTKLVESWHNLSNFVSMNHQFLCKIMSI